MKNDSKSSPEVIVPAVTAGGKLFDDLRGAIESGKLREGDRIAPIRELAARYQIAFDTARATVGRLEKLSLVRRRRGAGTFVTPRLVPGTAEQITTVPAVGLLVEAKGHLFGNLTADIVDLLQQRGVASIGLGWRADAGIEQIDHVLRTWRQQPPRAVVIQLGPEGIESRIDAACGGKTTIIFTFRGAPIGSRYSSVNPDNTAAFKLAARTLMDRGHRRLGFITRPRFINPEMPHTLRRRTMDDTEIMLVVGHMTRDRDIKKHGLSIFRHGIPVGNGDENSLAQAEAVERCAKWLRRAKPTGIIGNDFRLVVACRAAESLGMKIGHGQDLELIGVGNTPWSEALNFDSVSLREDLIARHIAKLIGDEIDEPTEAVHHIVVAPRLVVRTNRDAGPGA